MAPAPCTAWTTTPIPSRSTITETYSRVTTDPTALTLSNPFPASRRGFSGVNGSYGQQSAEPKSQYMQSWNLTIEREFGQGTVLEAAYAGSKGTHLQRRYDINQAGRDQANRNLRPYPFFGSIEIINDGSNSIYNSGQLTLRRRFSKQLFVRATYTYAKSIDETSNTGGTIAYNFAIAQDSRNLKLERGRSDFDIGHTFAGSFIWTPQFYAALAGARLAACRHQHHVHRRAVHAARGQLQLHQRRGEPPRPHPHGYGRQSVAGPLVRPRRLRAGSRWAPTGSATPAAIFWTAPGAIIINTSLSRRFRFGESRARCSSGWRRSTCPTIRTSTCRRTTWTSPPPAPSPARRTTATSRLACGWSFDAINTVPEMTPRRVSARLNSEGGIKDAARLSYSAIRNCSYLPSGRT